MKGFCVKDKNEFRGFRLIWRFWCQERRKMGIFGLKCYIFIFLRGLRSYLFLVTVLRFLQYYYFYEQSERSELGEPCFGEHLVNPVLGKRKYLVYCDYNVHYVHRHNHKLR